MLNVNRIKEIVMKFSDLYHWTDPVQSGVVFGSVLLALISICYFSLISVFSYASLLVLIGVMSVKIGVYVMVTFMKKEVANPIVKYSGMDLTIPVDKVSEFSGKAAENTNKAISELRRLFLVESMFDSVKFGLGLWFMTYIGSWFNMMTLIILAWVGVFTIPKVYINNKAAIDPILEKISVQVEELKSKAKTAMPGGVKEPKKEE